jgi:uncharacterized protein (DUF952 family)/predicted cupin superfamily sugar epimerase
VNASTVLHLLPLSAYQASSEAITSPTLDTQGFVHCSPDVSTTLAVADTLYRSNDEPMIALELDTARLRAPVHWEAPDPAPPEGVAKDVLFPHVYGPLDRDAIVGVRYARRAPDGHYLALPRRGSTASEFDLLPDPDGGWSRLSWTSGGGSAQASYFVLEEAETSRWVRASSDELWLWHRGSGMTFELGGREERPRAPSETLPLGPGSPQVLVSSGTWWRATAGEGEALSTRIVAP